MPCLPHKPVSLGLSACVGVQMTSRIEEVRIESCAPISQTSDTRGKLVTRCLNQLRPHASYVRHGLSVSAAKLSALIAIGEVTFREPIHYHPGPEQLLTDMPGWNLLDCKAFKRSHVWNTSWPKWRLSAGCSGDTGDQQV